MGSIRNSKDQMRMEHLRNSERDALHWRTALIAKDLGSHLIVNKVLVKSLKQRKGMSYIKKYLRKYISP